MTLDEMRSATAEMTLDDWREMTDWIRDQPIAIVRKIIARLKPTPVIERIMVENATAASLALGLLTSEGLRHLYSVEGVTYWLFLSLRRHDPKVQWEQVTGLVDFDNVGSVAQMLQDKNSLLAATKDTEAENPTSPASA